MRAKSLFTTLGILLLIPGSSSEALDDTNLLANPGFDIDTAFWTENHRAFLSWDSSDADGALDSGSAEIEQIQGETFGGQIDSDCVALDSPEIALGGSFYVPSGQLGDPLVLVQVWMYGEPDCAGSPVGPTASTNNFVLGLDTWFEKTSVGRTVHDGTVSAFLRVNVSNGVVDPFVVRADDLFLVPMLFSDGFESGDTMEWSGGSNNGN